MPHPPNFANFSMPFPGVKPQRQSMDRPTHSLVLAPPPRSWSTMCIVAPALILYDSKVRSSASCFPEKMRRIWSTWIPSFSCRACFTARTWFSGSKLKACFRPVSVLMKIYVLYFVQGRCRVRRVYLFCNIHGAATGGWVETEMRAGHRAETRWLRCTGKRRARSDGEVRQVLKLPPRKSQNDSRGRRKSRPDDDRYVSTIVVVLRQDVPAWFLGGKSYQHDKVKRRAI